MLHQEVGRCVACASLSPWRQFGPAVYGTTATRYMLVGEAPGFVSWRNGRRFTGPAGQLIRRALARVGQGRSRELEDLFYMTDAVKCHPAPPDRPGSNRSPTAREIQACSAYLTRELEILRPAVVITFGNTAAAAVGRALAGRAAHRPEVISFPHPSPRNQLSIRRRYGSMAGLERAIARTFGRLIARLDEPEAPGT